MPATRVHSADQTPSTGDDQTARNLIALLSLALNPRSLPPSSPPPPPAAGVILSQAAMSSIIVNTTWDNADSNFQWFGLWDAVNSSSAATGFCVVCDVVQPLGVFDGTYAMGVSLHSSNETAVYAHGSFVFLGSAIYLYGVGHSAAADDWPPGYDFQPSIVFSLDPAQGGSTQRTTYRYAGNASVAYNTLFFSAEGLSTDTFHRLSWNITLPTTTTATNTTAIALFDYAVVTSLLELGPPVSVGTSSGSASLSRSTASTWSSFQSASTFSSTSSSQIPNIIPRPGPGPTSAASNFTQAGTGATTGSDPSSSLTHRSSGPNTRTGILTGSILGALALTALLIILFLRRRRVQRQQTRTRSHFREQMRARFPHLESLPPRTSDIDAARGSLASSGSSFGSGMDDAQQGTLLGRDPLDIVPQRHVRPGFLRNS
uniref:Uncharacterized protein n=1 Tax=Mycena chlorophos TaxID=658473 RepID=A0ABQ0LPS3_MYCCL|nr:predicted protein [Mycena chlorophos]